MTDGLARAVAFHRSGRFRQAERGYEAHLRADPSSLPARYNLSILLLEQGKHQPAIQHLEFLRRTYPGQAGVLFTLGRALAATGRSAEAIAALQEAARLAPGDGETWLALGDELSRKGQIEEAIAVYRQAVAATPGAAAGHASLGRDLIVLGRYEEAEETLRRGLAAAPDNPFLHLFLGQSLTRQKRFAEAAAALEAALALQPGLALAKSHLLRNSRILADWAREEQLTADLRAEIRKIRRGQELVVPTEVSLLFDFSNEERAIVARAQAKLVAERVKHVPRASPSVAAGRPGPLRIGYLSPDFRTHAICQLIVELLERHDRGRVEIFGYSLGPNDGGPWRARAEAAFDHFVDLRTVPVEEAVGRIAADGIDILVDLAIYMQFARPEIPALRPAPLQVHWPGLPGTSGAEWFDYILADPVVIPTEHETAFTEKILRLPHSFQPNRSWTALSPAPSRASQGLPADATVLCAINDNRKIDRVSFATWMRILRRVPTAVLWLLDTSAEATARFAEVAAAAGVDPARLVYAARLPVERHIERLATADLFLDTMIYGAHTTASEALRAGVPVVTLAGPTFASRVAASLLTAVGAPALIARNLAEYEDLAVALAGDDGRRSQMRELIAHQVPTSPLFDPGRLARNVETAFETIHARRLSGKPPVSLDIDET